MLHNSPNEILDTQIGVFHFQFEWLLVIYGVILVTGVIYDSFLETGFLVIFGIPVTTYT